MTTLVVLCFCKYLIVAGQSFHVVRFKHVKLPSFRIHRGLQAAIAQIIPLEIGNEDNLFKDLLDVGEEPGAKSEHLFKQIGREDMGGHYNWKVPIKLIDVKLSLASYRGDKLEIHTKSCPRDLDRYCIISYVWSHKNKFEVVEVWSGGNKKDLVSQEQEGTSSIPRKRHLTIKSCSLASFVGMLDICDQMGMEHVWIDCVCVEQKNHGVKSLQLAEMGYYYDRATKCLVFLNGLDMYVPLVFDGGYRGAWYNRVWTVQEAAYTFHKKVFVHVFFPSREVQEALDIITLLEMRPEHVDLISSGLTGLEFFQLKDIPPTSKWYLGLVCEENYPDFEKLLVQLAKEIPWDKKFHNLHILNAEWGRKPERALDVKPDNAIQVIREAMRESRGCQYEQDRVYSIMTLLGIELEVSYEISLRDTVCMAAKVMSPQMLVHFVTATWFTQHGHALPDVTIDSGVDMIISNCITYIKVEESDLLITTKTKSVIISYLQVAKHYAADSMFESARESYGWACLIDDQVKARGAVDRRYCLDPADEYAMKRAKLLFMGKSSIKGFVVNSDGTCDDEDEPTPALNVPANVCLVVCHVNGVWVKIGVLYAYEDLAFDPEPEQLVLKL